MAANIWHTVVLPQPVSPTRSTGSLNSQALPEIKHNKMLEHNEHSQGKIIILTQFSNKLFILIAQFIAICKLYMRVKIMCVCA
jgi:hypothetical protein